MRGGRNLALPWTHTSELSDTQVILRIQEHSSAFISLQRTIHPGYHTILQHKHRLALNPGGLHQDVQQFDKQLSSLQLHICEKIRKKQEDQMTPEAEATPFWQRKNLLFPEKKGNLAADILECFCIPLK